MAKFKARYTGELKEGMKVWVVDTKADVRIDSGREHVIEFNHKGHSIVALDDSDQYWPLKRKSNGEWWNVTGDLAYISHVISEPEEKKEEHVRVDMWVPCQGDCSISIAPITNSPPQGAMQTIMDTLTSIPAKIKRFLNANYRAFYQLGWVDENLNLTEKGGSALQDFLFDKYEKELGEVAIKEVAQIKKAAKKKDDDEE